jgi:hypothetical protein
LKSIADDAIDTWSIAGKKTLQEGGELQFYIPDNQLMKGVK